MKANTNLGGKNKNSALEIKGYLSNLELDFIDNDLSEDIKKFFKDKQVNCEEEEEKEEEDADEDVSHEAQISFIIDHGFRADQSDLKHDHIYENSILIEFYGIVYYIKVIDYGMKQNIFNFLKKNCIVSVAA